jgi:predicted permease
MNSLLQDVRFGLRMFIKNPGFTFVAVITIALGIGANTAIFSVIYGVLLKPLPYPQPDRLVRLFEHHARSPKFPISPANFRDFRSESHTLEAMAVYMRRDLQIGGERPEQISGMGVSSGFFTLLGWQMEMGRDFLPEEEIDGKHRVVILSHKLWEGRFSSDPNIIGQQVNLSGEPFTVVGVLPPGFQHVGGEYRSQEHGETVDIWRPLVFGPQQLSRGSHFLNGIGRLAPGATREQAEAEMKAIAASLEERYPNSNNGWTARVEPLRHEIVGKVEPMLMVLLGAVALVLLVVCVNVAGLLLARSTARAREITIRVALGAGRNRIIRQLITESIILAILGGVGGVLIAVWGVDLLIAMAPDKLPRLHMVSLDKNVLAFSLGLTFITGLLFGITPAIQGSRSDLTEALKEGGRSGTGFRSQRLRRTLVTVEVALAFVLLTGAGLLLKSFITLTAQNPGFQSEGILTVGLWLPPARYKDADMGTFPQRLIDNISTLPGVQSVGATSDLPWTGYDENSGLSIQGRQFPPGEGPGARYHFVSPDYFRTISVPLIAGRFLTTADDANAPLVILINESFARKYWWDVEGAGDPVGARVQAWGRERTIVGVIGDVKDTPSDHESKPAFYFPFAQQPQREMIFAIRTNVAPMSLAESVRQSVRDIDTELPVTNLRTLDEIAGTAVKIPRFVLMLVSVFAGTALFLAAIGIYGVMSHSVTQRTREIGIRQALGARKGDVIKMITIQGMKMASIGVGAGLISALAITRFVESLLYEVSATDPVTFIVIALLLTTAALLACYIPARRATKVDPIEALRYE